MVLYVTKNGLRIVSNRLISNLLENNSDYAGKLTKARLYDADDRYVEAILAVGLVNDYDICPYSFSTDVDYIYDNVYSYLTMELQYIIPDTLMIYNEDSSKHEELDTTMDIIKIDFINENDIVFTTYYNKDSTKLFTVTNDQRDYFKFELRIHNDLSPTEWSNYARSIVTRFGLYVTGNRLVFDNNSSSAINPPVGFQLFERQTAQGLDDTDYFNSFVYDSSVPEWTDSAASDAIESGDKIRIASEKKFNDIYLELSNTPDYDDDVYITIQYYNGDWTNLQTVGDKTFGLLVSGHIE